jgi:oxygen-independent coproporphyrinogen-3 oxidase
VDPAHIAQALELIPRKPGFRPGGGDPEWECTIEANPGSLNPDKLNAYAEAGVNRLSVGLQSTHETHLKMLGRVHTYGDFRANIREARDAGFENINADLIFGLPGQTAVQWEPTLEAVVSAGVCHLSCYSLSVEEGTPLYKSVTDGELPIPDEDLDRDMYGFAIDYLRSAGIYQYELSNFAKPGRECRHNLKYWTGGRYVGFGAGAHSYDGYGRFSNAAGIREYINRDGGGCAERAANDTGVVIDAAEREKEFIILRLRLTDGFGETEFLEAFKRGFLEKYAAEAGDLIDRGLIETIPAPQTDGCRADNPSKSGRRVRLTRKGMDLANQVFIRFI